MKRADRRAVFFDRDGTIIHDLGYPRDPQEVRLLPEAGEALSRLRQEGFNLVLVSNQSGVGRGLLTMHDVEQVHRRVVALLAEHDAHLDGVYYCLHAPWEGCTCRKPRPGMLLQAAEELRIDLACSFMVGDKLEDVQAGKEAGCRTILMNKKVSSRTLDPTPDYLAIDWSEVASHILSHLEK